MNLPNLIISASLIFIYFFGTVSIASVTIAGHYGNVTRTPTEDAYLVFSVIGFFLEIGLTVCFVFASTELNIILNILLMIKDGIFGISLAGIGISCAVLEGSQRSGIYGNVVGNSNIYSNYNYGAFAAAAFFAFLNVIAFVAHFIYTLLCVLQVNTTVQPLNSILNNLNNPPVTSYTNNQNNTLSQKPQNNKQVLNLKRPNQQQPAPYQVELNPNSNEFKEISNKTTSTIQKHAGNFGGIYSTFKIIKIERITNPTRRLLYDNRKIVIEQENNNDANERLFFHGSTEIDKIINEGFDERYANINGMFGAGIYFAEHSSKSNQYVGPCALHQNRSCYSCARVLLYCRVCLGNSFVENGAKQYAHPPPGYHSVTGRGGLAYPEYVVYRGEQAYPEFKITYLLQP